MQLSTKAIVIFFLAAIFSVPAFADDASSHTALPGALNYVEGNVSLARESSMRNRSVLPNCDLDSR